MMLFRGRNAPKGLLVIFDLYTLLSMAICKNTLFGIITSVAGYYLLFTKLNENGTFQKKKSLKRTSHI